MPNRHDPSSAILCDRCGLPMEWAGDSEWRCVCGYWEMALHTSDLTPGPGTNYAFCQGCNDGWFYPAWMPIVACGDCTQDYQITPWEDLPEDFQQSALTTWQQWLKEEDQT